MALVEEAAEEKEALEGAEVTGPVVVPKPLVTRRACVPPSVAMSSTM